MHPSRIPKARQARSPNDKPNFLVRSIKVPANCACSASKGIISKSNAVSNFHASSPGTPLWTRTACASDKLTALTNTRLCSSSSNSDTRLPPASTLITAKRADVSTATLFTLSLSTSFCYQIINQADPFWNILSNDRLGMLDGLCSTLNMQSFFIQSHRHNLATLQPHRLPKRSRNHYPAIFAHLCPFYSHKTPQNDYDISNNSATCSIPTQSSPEAST